LYEIFLSLPAMKVGDLIRVKPHVRLDFVGDLIRVKPHVRLDFEGGNIGIIVKIVDAEALWSSDDYAWCVKALIGEQVYLFRKSEIEVYESR